MPSMCFRPSLAMALRAFFSLREWTATEEPAGTLTSPPVGEALGIAAVRPEDVLA